MSWSSALTTCQLKGLRFEGAPTALAVRWCEAGVSACRLQPAALRVAVAFEDQSQAVQGQVLVVVGDGLQLGQQQRRGVAGGDDRDVVAGKAVHVFADAPDQAVDQTGESEYG